MERKGRYPCLGLAGLLAVVVPLAACTPSRATPTALMEATPTEVTRLPTSVQVTVVGPPAQTAPSSLAPAPKSTRELATAPEGFVVSLLERINARDFPYLQQVMSKPFVLGLYPMGRDNRSVQDAVIQLQSQYLPDVPSVTLSNAEVAAIVPEGMRAEALFEGPIAEVVSSFGWGLSGTGEGLLFVTEEDGEYRWAGLIVTYERFAPVPDLETIAPPSGLIYRLENEWWHIDPDGEPQLLIQHQDTLSLNPSVTLALHANPGAHELTLFHLPSGGSRTIEIEATLLHGSWAMSWLDDRTAVVVAASGQQAITQGSTGYLALLDVVDGQPTMLEPQLSLWSQPAVASDHTIVYQCAVSGRPHVWRNGETKPLNVGDLEIAGVQHGDLFNPVLAPDRTKLAGVIDGDFGPHTSDFSQCQLCHAYRDREWSRANAPGQRSPLSPDSTRSCLFRAQLILPSSSKWSRRQDRRLPASE